MRRAPVPFGGCSRIRTYDPLIKSQLLYQLSYAPQRSGLISAVRQGWQRTKARPAAIEVVAAHSEG